MTSSNDIYSTAIRLPGTINPTTGQPELIMADTIMPLPHATSGHTNDRLWRIARMAPSNGQKDFRVLPRPRNGGGVIATVVVF